MTWFTIWYSDEIIGSKLNKLTDFPRTFLIASANISNFNSLIWLICSGTRVFVRFRFYCQIYTFVISFPLKGERKFAWFIGVEFWICPCFALFWAFIWNKIIKVIFITTVFPQIDPAGTIYYLRSWVRVLIEGRYYSKIWQNGLNLAKNWPKTAKFRVVAILSLLRVQFKGGYYSSVQPKGAGSMQGRVLSNGGNYLRNYGTYISKSKPYVGKWGGHRGVLPPSGFGPPLILPLSNHCLPHFLIFKLEPPSSKLLNPLVEKFLTPKLKNFWFCKKGPNPLVEFWWLPPSRFSELEPPTSKILDPLPEEKNSAKKGQNPLVEKKNLQKRSQPPS